MPKGLVRYHQTGHSHFVTFSCYQRKPLLNHARAYEVFERELEAARKRYDFYVFGYVLMPEHVHLLLTEPRLATLDLVLQMLKQKIARKLNQEAGMHFWQQRYYDFNVLTEEKRIEKLKYIHRNPVVRGLVAQPED